MSAPPLEPNNFDRSKPFYPLVVAHICLLFAYKELSRHGAARMLHAILEDENEGTLEEWRKTNDASDAVRAAMERMARATELELMPPLELASKVQGKIKIDAEIVAEDLAQNTLYLARSRCGQRAACSSWRTNRLRLIGIGARSGSSCGTAGTRGPITGGST